MVVFADLHKLLLYQRLNLGFECNICKQKFYNRLEHLQHTITCTRVPVKYKCEKCGKTFGHQKILQLHLQIHNLSESSHPKSTDVNKGAAPKCIDITESNTNEEQPSNISVENTQISSNLPNEDGSLNYFQSSTEAFKSFSRADESHILNSSLLEPTQTLPKKQPSHTVKARRKTASKNKVGLTKVRMEDCLRCDDCSCIYIDPTDYYKHMRNFHRINFDNTPIPPQKTRKRCQSCCKQCRGVNCGGARRPRASQAASNLIFRFNMRDNIQDRWMKMMSQQLSKYPLLQLPTKQEPEVDIKPDPDAITIKPDPDPAFDLSQLLSQVEVKIKTEPPDD